MIDHTEAARRRSLVSSVCASFLALFMARIAQAQVDDAPQPSAPADMAAPAPSAAGDVAPPSPSPDALDPAPSPTSDVAPSPTPFDTAAPAPSSVPPPYAIAAAPEPAPGDQAGLDAARLSPPPAPHSAEYEATTPNAAPPARGPVEDGEGSDDHDDDDKSPMGWLSVTLKVGYGHINSGSLDNPTYDPTVADALNTLRNLVEDDGMLSAQDRAQLSALAPDIAQRIPTNLDTQQLQDLVQQVTQGTQAGACTPIMPKCRTPQRGGVQVGVTLHVGGDGFGWDAEPYILAAANAFAVGVYTGPKFDIHIAEPLYFGFGLGGKVAYVMADGWKYGADIYGRIPVHFTYYVSPNFALELEGAFGAGVTGYATEPKNYIVTSAPEFKFGSARSWDITFGIRFP